MHSLRTLTWHCLTCALYVATDKGLCDRNVKPHHVCTAVLFGITRLACPLAMSRWWVWTTCVASTHIIAARDHEVCDDCVTVCCPYCTTLAWMCASIAIGSQPAWMPLLFQGDWQPWILCVLSLYASDRHECWLPWICALSFLFLLLLLLLFFGNKIRGWFGWGCLNIPNSLTLAWAVQHLHGRSGQTHSPQLPVL